MINKGFKTLRVFFSYYMHQGRFDRPGVPLGGEYGRGCGRRRLAPFLEKIQKRESIYLDNNILIE